MLTLRNSPFDLFERLDQQLSTAERVPSAEVHDVDDAYEIVMELPGVDKSSIDVKATDQTLVISAERRSSRPLPADVSAAAAPTPDAPEAQARKAERAPTGAIRQSGERSPLLSEFRYGTWSRSFRFPGGINREGLEAHYRDGLLTVRAPKAQTMTTVTVNVES